jgi:hypothetical protein
MKHLTPILLLAGMLIAVPAKSDIISIALNSATLSGAPGDSLIFEGTLQNLESSIVDLIGCELILLGQFTIDCTSQFLVFAPFALAPNETTPLPFGMFQIAIDLPFTDPIGPYFGTFTVIGGVDGNVSDILGEAAFTVVVTPEPGTGILLALAFAAIALVRRRVKHHPRTGL